jgi:hypothetical protein
VTGDRPPVGVALLGLVALAMVLATTVVLVRGWPGSGQHGSEEELRKLRHAVCEVLAVSADATTAADVEACTFEDGD